MYKRILTKLEQATVHYQTCRLKAEHFPHRGMYYCQGAFCKLLFMFACLPFFLRQREEGYQAYIHSSDIGKMTFEAFLLRRKIAGFATLAFLGITGFTLLRPIFEGNTLPRRFVTVYESLTPNSWEVFFETDLYTTSTNNYLEDRYPSSMGHLAVWQQKTDNGWQVRAYDNEAQKVYSLTEELGDHVDIHTDGRYVVWQLKRQGIWRIFYWDAQEPDTEYKQLSDTRMAMHPRISEGVVVWQEWLNNNWEIIKRDMNAPQRKRLTNNDTPDISPDILGKLIVWQAKGTDGDSQIRVFHQGVEEEAGVFYDAVNQIDPYFDSKGYLHWFAYEEDGYVSDAYNYLSDDFIRRVIDPERARKPKGADGAIIPEDGSTTSTEAGTIDATSTTSGVSSSSTEPIPSEASGEDKMPEEPPVSSAPAPEATYSTDLSPVSATDTTPTEPVPVEVPVIVPEPVTTSTSDLSAPTDTVVPTSTSETAPMMEEAPVAPSATSSTPPATSHSSSTTSSTTSSI